MAASSLDTTFSGDGKAVVNFLGAADIATDVAVQADGKVVVAGRADVPPPAAGDFPWRAVGLARLNANGALDATFGRGGADGDGRVMFQTLDDASAGQSLAVGGTNAKLLALPDGKLLVLVAAGTDVEGGGGVALVRLKSDGTLDNTFGGGDGVASAFVQMFPDPYRGALPAGLAVAPDGRIVVVANIGGRHSTHLTVTRFLSDGTSDASFAPTAPLEFGEPDPEVDTSNAAGDVTVAPDGDIIIAGTYAAGRSDFAVLRIAPNGAVRARTASAFGGSNNSDLYDSAEGAAVALLPDGDILVGGTAYFPDFESSDFAIARLNGDLSRDTGFGGGDGVVTSHFGSALAQVRDLAVLPGGKVLVGGSVGGVFALARYNADGSADTTFDSQDAAPDGRKTTSFSGGAAGANALAVAPDGKIVAAGFAGGTGAASDMAVARYQGDTVVTPPTGGAVTYQAEQGRLSGANVSKANAGYTGTGYADFITSQGSYVELEVDVPAAGRYRIDTRFANGGSRRRMLDLYVDGGAPRAGVAFEPTGSWTNWRTSGVDAPAGPTLTLPAGRHLLRFQTVGNNGPNIDSVTLTPLSAAPRFEAEDAKLVGAVVRRGHPGYTGSGFADFTNDSGDSIEWTVSLPDAGVYELDFRYANGGSTNRPLALSLDGVLYEPQFAFAPTGVWDNWSTATAGFGQLRLSAGTHVIKLATIGRNGPNLDSLTMRAI
jgi:uncharacterized delta-60 repeat protein